MEFRLLGPLEAEGGDGLVSLGGDKQRTVLALLLLQANRLVTADRLIAQVWDGDPPSSARNVVQTYVSRLRKSLGPERLESRQGGYLLHAAPEEVDAERFAALVQEARTASPIDAEASARLYRQADELWRGPALADLDEQPALRGEIIHLEELRAAATEERIVVELARGHPADLVAELEALTAANPLREALWGHLMTALYRSGRQADALAAYRRARDVLADELALDPSAELQRLERRVLEQDPSLDVAGVPIRGLRLLERIGQGSFGVVHRAAQPHVGRDVAVKVVRPRFANDPEFIRLFEAEAQMIARLEHPHIVPLYDYWRDPTGTFLVMRLLRGGSLRDLLARGPVPTDEALAVVEHVGAALATAHRQGVVHRDVKPANILFDEDRNAYLSDFGIAMDVTVVREVKGSLEPDSSSYYLSPEELRGETPTARADIYSLGLVLFEMLAGRPPWVDGRGTGAAAGARQELPALSSLRPDLSPDVDAVVRRATRDDPVDRYPDVTVLVSAIAQALVAAPIRPLAEVPARNPYKGLRPFLEPDASDFFGREHLVRRLVDRLAGDAADARLLALVGASGSGKSSAVHAGLVPALRAGAVSGSERWLVATMTPGSTPFDQLAKAFLVLAATPPPRGVLEALERDGAALLKAVDWLLPDETSNLLLVVDQLEEVFVLAPESIRTRFLAVLGEAAAKKNGRLRVVLTLRADYFDRPLAHPALADHLHSGTELVTALRPDELERAITGPANQVGIAVDPRLVAQLVSDVHDQPGALPLLQFALAELVDRCGSVTLTPEVYAELGGVAGAVARGAEEIYGSLPPVQQDQARQMFLRMVHRVDAAGATRRRAHRSELVSLADDGAGMEAVIDTFVRRRMLSLDRDADTREPTVELAHESLLRAWARLGRWIEDAQDDLRVRRQLARAAADWRRAANDTAFLLVGSRLDLVASWRSRTDLAVTPDEDAFLDASLSHRALANAKEAAQQARERTLEHRALRRLQHLVVALVLGIVVAGGLTLFAFDQRGEADRERRIAVIRELAAAAVANLDVDPERSIMLALEAVEESRVGNGAVVPEAAEALHRAVGASRIVLRVPGLGGALDWSPDGNLFVTEGPEESGLVDIREAATGKPVRSFRGHDADINIVAFSPDGSRLGTGADDGTVRVWDTATGERLHTFLAQGQMWGVTFSPDGSLLAATSWSDGRVRVWDLETGDLVQEAGPFAVSFTTSFSPDGRRLAVATFDTDSVVVDVRTGAEAVLLERQEAGVLDVDWSPDGRWIATSGLDGTVTIHDARTGRSESVLSGHRGQVVAADWSPDSGRLVTGSADGTVRLWGVSATGGRELLMIPVQERGGGLWVAFSPDGHRVMAGDQAITSVKVFDVSEGGDAEWANLPTGTATAVDFAPDGVRLVTSTGDGSVIVWNSETGREAATLGARRQEPPDWAPLSVSSRGEVAFTAPAGVAVRSLDRAAAVGQVDSPEPPADLAWNPDGSLLAVSGPGGRLEIVDRTGREVAELDEGPGFWLTSAQFSPDGRLVAAARSPSGRPVPGKSTVTIWDWRAREVVREIRAGGRVVFSPSGTLLATAPDFGPVRVWDLEGGDLLARLVGHTGSVTDLEFSPTGTDIATSSADGTVRLWNATTGLEHLALRGHRGAVVDVAFSPDGARLASAGTDGVVRVWALDLEDLVVLAERSLTRPLTREECSRYVAACD